MKLLRYGRRGHEKPGMIDSEGNIRDLSGEIDDLGGNSLSDASIRRLKKLNPYDLPRVKGRQRYGPCVANVGKFLCIGLNYSDHAKETGLTPPEHPILFMKATSAIVGPNDDIVMPRKSKATDWEVELGVIIGRKCKYVAKKDAVKHVAGYCIVNDVSERDYQIKLSGQWTKGKSCDTFGPIGPWLVTRDEIPNPHKLDMALDVNNKRMQTGNTSTMIFSVADIVSHLSQLMTLYPGDIISTGTPPGVGLGMKPKPKFLKSGDVMDLWIEGLGKQRQRVRADK